jgi:Flp pilus assembly protein TadG
LRKHVGGRSPVRTETRIVRATGGAGPRRWLERLRSLANSVDGGAAVEFGLAVPLLVGLLVPVADLGIAYSQKILVDQAAQAGAQYAALHPWHSNSAAEIANAVTSATTLPIAATPAPRQICGCPSGTAVTEATCGSTCSTSETAGYYVVVNAQLPYTPVLPYSVLGDSVTLASQTTVRIR